MPQDQQPNPQGGQQPGQQPGQQADPPPVSPGDPLPFITLPNAMGNGVSLGHQDFAGRWQVLAFVEPADAPARADAAAAAQEQLKASEGVLFTIALGEPDQAATGADLFDASRKAAGFLLGKPMAGIAIISPEGRLAARFGDRELDKAVAFCVTHHASQTAAQVTGFAPVLVIEEVLEPELCSRLIEFWDAAPKEPDTGADQGHEAALAGIKRRTDAMIQDGPLFDEIKARVGRRVLPFLGRAFQMMVASMEAPRVGCYAAENDGAFGRHRDNVSPFTAHRRFAMTLNRNSGD